MKDEVAIGVDCVTLRMSLRKERHVGNLQWDIMWKGLTAWAYLYGAVVLEMGYTIYYRDGEIFTETACSIRGPWFGKFM